MNVVVLRGTLSSEPVVRTLASGSVLISLEVTTTVDDVAMSVPVAWFDPGTDVAFTAGDDVLVRGSARRRFFRAGGVTQSRTEVVAAEVIPAKRARQTKSLVSRALALIDQ